MATITEIKPKIIILEFRQEKTDKDYGTCLWGRFYFDTENYTLTIESDCGNYGYGWVPTPEHETFLHLMSRIKGDYLIEKIASRTVINSEKTWENFKSYVDDVLLGEEPDFNMQEAENTCYYCRSEYELNAEIYHLIEGSIFSDYFDSCEIYSCIEKDYTASAKKITEVYEKYIVPQLTEMEKKHNGKQ